MKQQERIEMKTTYTFKGLLYFSKEQLQGVLAEAKAALKEAVSKGWEEEADVARQNIRHIEGLIETRN